MTNTNATIRSTFRLTTPVNGTKAVSLLDLLEQAGIALPLSVAVDLSFEDGQAVVTVAYDDE